MKKIAKKTLSFVVAAALLFTSSAISVRAEGLKITKIYADLYGIDVTFNAQPTEEQYAATILDHNKNNVSYTATYEKVDDETHLVHYDFSVEAGKNYRYTLGTLADKSVRVTKYLEEDFNSLTAATATSNEDGSKTVPYSAMTGTGKVGTWKTTGKSFITDSEDLCASATDKKLALCNADSFMYVTGDIQTSYDDKTLMADVISLGSNYMFVNSDRVGRVNSRAVEITHTGSTMGFVNGHASEGKYKNVWKINSNVSPTKSLYNKSTQAIAGGSLVPNSTVVDTTASTLNYTIKVKPNAQTKMILRDNGDLLTVLGGADTIRYAGTLRDHNETQLTNSEPDFGFESLGGNMMIIDNVVVTACEVTDPMEELEITKIYADLYGIDVTFNRQPTQDEYTANIYDNKGNDVSYNATYEKVNDETHLVHYDFSVEAGKNYRYTLGTLADKSVRVTKYLEEDFNSLTAATATSNEDGSKTVPYSAMTGTGKVGTWKTTGKSFITDSEDLCASATDKKLALCDANSFMYVTGDIQTSYDDKTLMADVISLGSNYMFVNSDRIGRVNSRAVEITHTGSTMGFVNGHASEGKYKNVWKINPNVSPTKSLYNKSTQAIAGGSLVPNSTVVDTTASTLNYTIKVKPNAQTKMILRDNGDLLTVLGGADTIRYAGTLRDHNETELTNSEPDLGFESLGGNMMIVDNVVVTACEVTDYAEGTISSMSITRPGSEIKMIASVSDTSFEKIIFAMAAYDEYGKLKDVAVETKSTQNGSAQAELTLDNFAIKDTIKAFVWNEDMKPISNPQGYNTEIKVSSLPGYGSDEIIELFEAPTICNFLNNKKAAVSMTLDDGYLDATKYLGALFKENNVRGTVMLRADWVEKWSDATKAEWIKTLEDGNMDVGNHSYSHGTLYDDTAYSAEELEEEVGGAYDILKSAFPNEKILTFAAPFNKTSAALLEVIEKYHGACRIGNAKLMSANPTLEEMYAVTAYSASNEKTADDLKGYVDSAVKDGKWLVMYFHEINESEASNEEDPTQKNNIKPSACVPFLEYVGENEDVWAGSFEEVVQYNREKLATTVAIKEINETSMKLSITDTLDNTLYDFPLTVKVNVPDQWSSVTVTQNGQSTEVVTVTENEKTYAYINIIPDKGEVELSTLNSLYGKELDSADYIAPAVCNFKDDKAAAVSVTFDDGTYEPAVYYNSLFEKYNIHGTAMLISSRLSSSNVALWQELIDEGNIDIGNHSRYHSKDYIQDNATAEKLADDITGGYSDLKEMFPNEKLLVYGSPWTWKSDASIAEIKKNHFAHRGSGNGFVSANPTDDELFAIPSHVIYSDDTVAELKGKVDTAVTNGSWYSMLLHGTNDVNPETAELTINKEVCDEVFEYIGTHKDVWAGSMTEVLQYIYEKKNCTSTVNWIRENAISLSLTDTLDNARFDFPLTLKVNVPSGWTNVTITQNSESIQVSAFEEGGKNYAYINVVPDNGEVVLENK